MKKKFLSETLQAHVDSFVPGGQGIATLENGKKAFIWGVLPGEDVEFQTTKSKSSYCEGVATKILKASPKRIEPKDECYLSTSPWQILDYNFELESKAELVKECFTQQKLDIEVLPTMTDGKEFFYRNKMEYSLYFNHDDEQIHLAFHKRGSHGKIQISGSSIERPELFARAKEIVKDLNDKHEEARKYQSMLLRCNQAGEVSGDLFENGKPHPIMNPLTDSLLGKEYSYSPNGFFQINLPVYELALKEIAKHVGDGPLLDLYAGVGSIGLSIAKDGQKLTLVEVNGAAVEEMKNNANGRPNTECILAKSEEVTEYITPDSIVILDPPRAGCDKKLIDKILEVEPQRVIYLSCNPITQARDAALLAEKYKISAAQPFNFFPRTPHIENLIVLEK
ncbi:class I SAM-dependent RNA methyltransferase [Candidatus Saccharibacteria bacterium]|nr:class I SAM-dependent RNA methyltransferase [Candidatus Saccharibacteria bacterium]